MSMYRNYINKTGYALSNWDIVNVKVVEVQGNNDNTLFRVIRSKHSPVFSMDEMLSPNDFYSTYEEAQQKLGEKLANEIENRLKRLDKLLYMFNPDGNHRLDKYQEEEVQDATRDIYAILSCKEVVGKYKISVQLTPIKERIMYDMGNQPL